MSEKHLSEHIEVQRPAKRQQITRRRPLPRASQACQACAISKTRCDNEEHCKRCRKRKIPCVRTFDIEERGPSVQATQPEQDLMTQPRIAIVRQGTSIRKADSNWPETAGAAIMDHATSQHGGESEFLVLLLCNHRDSRFAD